MSRGFSCLLEDLSEFSVVELVTVLSNETEIVTSSEREVREQRPEGLPDTRTRAPIHIGDISVFAVPVTQLFSGDL